MEFNDPLYNHIKKEDMLSISDYSSLSRYGCKKDTKAYRGFFFRTEKEYNDFISIVKSGDYRPNNPESFTRSYNIAEEFAKQRKTFFFHHDHNIALEHSYKNMFKENLSGYGGVIIETIIPEGKGVDINRTNYKEENQSEDEIIYYEPNGIDYKYHIIESFENQLKNNPIDINLHIKENGIEDALSEYIIFNHQDELNKDTQLFILDTVLSSMNNKEQSSSIYYVDESTKNVMASEIDGSLLGRNRIDIRFHFGKIFNLYENGTFTDKTVLSILEKSVDTIIEEISDFIETEHIYGERDLPVYYDLSYVTELSHLASEPYRERLKDINNLAIPRHYDDINDEIRDLNYREDLSEEDKYKLFQEKANEIKDFIESKISGIPKSKEQVEESINLKKSKKEEVKQKINKLRNK